MMKYIILGIVQGLTEFFPVSSSGHLVIMQNIFKMQGDLVFLDVVLHLGTTLALIIFFFKDILNLCIGFFGAVRDIIRRKGVRIIWRGSGDLRLGVYILISTAITGVIGYTNKDFFQKAFSSVRLVSLTIFITGVILILTKKFGKGRRDLLSLRTSDAVLLGIVQGISIIPGISRSGSTISSLLFRGIDKDTAFRFSFLAAIPAILGAFALKLKDASYSSGLTLSYALGFFFSFVFGMLALRLLKKLIHQAKFFYFGYYCIILSLTLWVLTLFKF